MRRSLLWYQRHISTQLILQHLTQPSIIPTSTSRCHPPVNAPPHPAIVGYTPVNYAWDLVGPVICDNHNQKVSGPRSAALEMRLTSTANDC